jgi:glycosyltransferase involved in cell wall biosynthesis
VRLADFVLTDTQSHKDYLCHLYSIDSEKVDVVWVGADDSFSKHAPKSPEVTSDQTKVLFYGQFIPLHGLDHLVQAISRIEALGRKDITFHIIGRGQEAAHIDAMITEMGIRSILRTPWVDYSQLPTLIAAADICLGIFPDGGKGGRVIPNKLFQIMAVGRPVVTAETSGIREILQPGPGVRLTAMGDSEDTANKILDLVDCLNDATQRTREIGGAMALPSIGPKQISLQLSRVLSDYLPTDLHNGER